MSWKVIFIVFIVNKEYSLIVYPVHHILWKENILHRDINLNNIMLSPSMNERECHQGLLIDLNYAFVIEPDDKNSVGKKGRKSPQASIQKTEDCAQNQEVLLHRMVCF